MIAAAQLVAALQQYQSYYNCISSYVQLHNFNHTYHVYNFCTAYTHTHTHAHLHTGRHTQLAAALQNAKVGEGLVCALKNAHEAGYILFGCVCTSVQIGGA